MTPKQIALVQDSFAKVALTSEAAAMLFYDRLFEIAPQMRAMFPAYPVVGAALLWTLEKGLGDGWTPEMADAWVTAYSTMSEYMISETYGRSRAAE
jgi:hemoglobin-like flavoprotein